uniref:Uncharacterized protein n=1 Tax=Arundo donax TaxID=35708 RepID=A0A0A9BSA4_ARUDO
MARSILWHQSLRRFSPLTPVVPPHYCTMSNSSQNILGLFLLFQSF